MHRSFTIESINRIKGNKTVDYTDGRFLSETPALAAKKVFSKAYRSMKAKGPLTLKIKLRETTQTSEHKFYEYKVSKIAEKSQIMRDGELITYYFKTKVKSI